VLAASTDKMWTCCKTCARDTPTYCLNGVGMRINDDDDDDDDDDDYLYFMLHMM
jgi:hypothetical protein